MPDLLEQTVRYLEALSDAAMDASPSTDASFGAEFVEALRECAEAVKTAREDLIDTGRPTNLSTRTPATRTHGKNSPRD
ncbi:hypothetical protein SIM91_03470 [Rhodococcus opacus]|uniref:hypothetical protein n=1 Tax=Rhodococcus opacus TaxID=37919 RepID=UPI000AD7448F|nr:hypothetical protein [Rhodococcus opacus]MDX5962400.1 hypothetical protein [Rhodococcus opacus]CAG7639397.1 hypothetical protein E143388_08082 [Rhodococcus opacus]